VISWFQSLLSNSNWYRYVEAEEHAEEAIEADTSKKMPMPGKSSIIEAQTPTKKHGGMRIEGVLQAMLKTSQGRRLSANAKARTPDGFVTMGHACASTLFHYYANIRPGALLLAGLYFWSGSLVHFSQYLVVMAALLTVFTMDACIIPEEVFSLWKKRSERKHLTDQIIFFNERMYKAGMYKLNEWGVFITWKLFV
jgi:hypothetical protein